MNFLIRIFSLDGDISNADLGEIFSQTGRPAPAPATEESEEVTVAAETIESELTDIEIESAPGEPIRHTKRTLKMGRKEQRKQKFGYYMVSE